MKDKIIKFLVVVCLTLLIWTWAFLSQEDTKTFSGTLEVSPATDRSLLVTFWVGGEEMGERLNLELMFKGTPAKITALSEQTEQAAPDKPQSNPLNYYYNPRDFNHTQSLIYPFNLLDFLQRSTQTKGLALTLVSCSINQESVERIEIQIEVLEKKQLPVECINENGVQIKGEFIEPAHVEMYVRKNYSGPAYVMLTSQQLELAQQRPIRVRPYVEMGAGYRRRALQEVTLSMPKETVKLQPRPFQPFQPPRRIGYIFGEKLLGLYTVEMSSESESSLRSINLRATDQAYEAYSKMRYPILIEIQDEDVLNPQTPLTKKIIYNFPREFVAKQAIELAPSQPQTAVIKLIPVATPPITP